MMLRILVVLMSLTAPLALAGDISPGGKMADLSIADKGELVLSGDNVDYRTWSYPQQPGKVHVLQYMAATRAASKINKPFTDKMSSDLPKGGVYLSTTILNLDEAMWGTSGMVVSELASKKQEFPDAIMVADAEGTGLEKWQLEKETSAIIVTDAQGVVRYFKQGAMSAAEIDSTLALISQYIGKGSTASAVQANPAIQAVRPL
jgi:YtfJ family uncharacterized protein